MANSSPPTAREQLLRLQKETFERLDEEIRAEQRHESRSFRAYRRAYDREVRGYRKISSKAELLEKVVNAPIVYCGDYHTLRQAQRTAIRILREVIPKRTVHLALEVVPQSGEKLANDYVRKRIDETRFLDGIHYEKRWGFPWGHYRQLFTFAREHALRILALNADDGDTMDLEARDQLAAELIVAHTLRFPDVLTFCLYGDLHLASSHIPRRVERLLPKGRLRNKALTIFQNSEEIYWDLTGKGLEDRVDVVEISPRAYCVLSAAPWIKWQSYRSWREDQTYLIDESPDLGQEEGISPDYYHDVLDHAKRIGRFLELPVTELEQFTVLTPQDTRIIDELNDTCLAEHADPSIAAIVRSEIVENGSCFFPERSLLYLSDISENRAAEKAAQLLTAKLDPGFSLFGRGFERREIFYRLVLWEAIAYFGSKIINPKRKCDRYRDFEGRLRTLAKRKLRGREREQREVARHVLRHRDFEGQRRTPRDVFRLPPRTFFLTASALGKILADRLYFMMMTDRIPKNALRELFRPFDPTQDHVEERYRNLSRLVRGERDGHASKEDRF